MTLLAPLFLAGLAAVALPIWLHRLKTQSPERQPFSSTMLLEASEQRVHVRKELRYWLLLSMRLLLLSLAALAFAKPLLDRPPAVISDAAPILHLIVIDTSLSMGHGDRLARAQAAAGDIVDARGDSDGVQIITAADTLNVVAGPTRDGVALGQALAGLHSGAGRLDLGALMAGLDGLVDPDLGATDNIRVHLISDFQASGQPARFADLVPAPINDRPVTLMLYPMVRAAAPNWTVEFIRPSSDGFEVGVRGFGADTESQAVTLEINGQRYQPETQTASLEGQIVFRFGVTALEAGDNRVVARLTSGDSLLADDVRFAVVVNAPAAPVLVITRDAGSLPVTYLTAALETVPRGYSAEVVNVADLDARILVRYPWVVVDDLGIVGERLAAALSDYLNGGGAVLAAVGEAALGRRSLPVTGHPLATTTSAIEELRAVTRIDASHPALARTRGWRAVNVAQRAAVNAAPEDRVLVGLSNGQPLLLERSFGSGRLLLLTTGLDNTWSDLPVQPVFVNFIAEAASYLSGEQLLDRDQVAGTSFALQQSGGASGQVIDPAGRTILTLADTRRAQDIRLSQLGFYEVYTPGREALVAVNPDPRESDLATMTEPALADWQSLLEQPPGAPAAGADLGLEPKPFELWRVLLILLASMVMVESLLGNRYLGRRGGVT